MVNNQNLLINQLHEVIETLRNKMWIEVYSTLDLIAKPDKKEIMDIIKREQDRDNILLEAKNNLCLVVKNGHLELLDTLIERGAKINIVDKDDLTILHWAAMNGHLKVVSALMEDARVDVNIAEKSGALHYTWLLIKAM
ncbi:ankyrin repeat domain-containing protein [Wolbachia endosymbiont of Tettigetta isshikii]|uniref:ankyrin repeat domain-containing protein n=1 Tax=Wolbachia endosymbiont of Tettigetta isshikii TaxID=3239093 RepID=UPI00398182F5